MKNIVIFGPPGSGKGTQSDKIIDEFGLAHISTGDVLRAEIAKETDLGILAKKYIDDGQLVPDDVIIGMLAGKLDELKNTKGVIFDGFPRTTAQAVALKEMLNERETDVAAMISLEVNKEELIDRLLKRGKASGRSDDNLETIEKRINVYHKQTAPVIEFYKMEGTHYPVHGVGSVDDIFSDIAHIISKA
ncbi:adenylate kinase [Saccharicrinis sp. FJH54]|uniref:adenylate kinase n=1 Tax=Saccharicrinis sp. FJH54 TaxID=3344665 RepID=UPI0035D42874